MSWGWEIDPPYKAYEEWERANAPTDEDEPEEDEHDECE